MKLVLIILLISTFAGCASAPVPTPYVAAPSAPHAAVIQYKEYFAWPIKGYILAPFGSKVDNVINKGIDIKTREGSSIKAARSGRVVYCDSYLKGFGKTIIIDHGEGLQTVYSYNSEILVNVGDVVAKYKTIARAGMTGRAKEPSLHFEVRKDGEPQNPLYYLPR